MYRGFPYIKLKEICDVNQGLQIPIDQRFTENGPNRYFYITVQFLKASHTNKFYVENPPASSICNEDDILIVRTGSTGQIVTGVNGCFHNNFFKINFNKDLVNGRYLYHCLNTKEKYKEMLRRAGVTTIPDLNHFMFLDMEIPLPEKNIQVQIAKTLDSLDSKIELNNKINAELEAMAKTIYDYWFVQFDFPNAKGKPYKTNGGKMVWCEELKREIPEGWEVTKIGEVATVKAGGDKPDSYTLEKTEINNVPIYSNGITNDGLYGYTSKSIISEQSVTISARGTIGFCVLRNKPFVPIIRLIALIPNLKGSAKYFYEALKNFIFENSGSVQQQLTVPQVTGIKILYPNEEILKKFDEITAPMINRMEIIKEESQKLSELRDWLLPMLMNGQVKVGDAEKIVEEKLSMASEEKVVYKKGKV
jgi:type I restriction enzyme S subunit